jgi:hypothetical protein
MRFMPLGVASALPDRAPAVDRRPAHGLLFLADMVTRETHIGGLMDGGDYACANAYHGGLAQVCRELAELLPPPHALRARKIARLAMADLPEATRQWCELTAELRGRGDAATH